jgi:hypothetical protein
MLVVFSFEVVLKIQILNFLNSDVVFVDNMTLNEKSCQLQNSITSQDLQKLFWFLVICSFHMMVLTICTNLIHLSCSFINYERDIGFINKFIFILSYEEIF